MKMIKMLLLSTSITLLMTSCSPPSGDGGGNSLTSGGNTPSADTLFGNKSLYFVANDTDGERNFYEIDTNGNLNKITNETGVSMILPMVNSSGIFLPSNTGNGLEPHEVNPSTGVLTEIANLKPGTAGSSVFNLGQSSTKVFYVSELDTASADLEIFMYDLTTNTNTQLQELNTNAGLYAGSMSGSNVQEDSTHIYFRAVDDTVGNELGRLDKSNGTIDVFDLNVIGNSMLDSQARSSTLLAMDSDDLLLYGDLNNGTGNQLVFFDKANEVAADLTLNSGGDADIVHINIFSGKYYIHADNGTNGRDLIVVDATTKFADSTTPIEATGADVGILSRMAEVGNFVYMSVAPDGTNYSLHAFNKSTGVVSELDTTNNDTLGTNYIFEGADGDIYYTSYDSGLGAFSAGDRYKCRVYKWDVSEGTSSLVSGTITTSCYSNELVEIGDKVVFEGISPDETVIGGLYMLDTSEGTMEYLNSTVTSGSMSASYLISN